MAVYALGFGWLFCSEGLVLDKSASQSFFLTWAVGSWEPELLGRSLFLLPGTPHGITAGLSCQTRELDQKFESVSLHNHLYFLELLTLVFYSRLF